jgi:hypothetical protein
MAEIATACQDHRHPPSDTPIVGGDEGEGNKLEKENPALIASFPSQPYPTRKPTDGAFP